MRITISVDNFDRGRSPHRSRPVPRSASENTRLTSFPRVIGAQRAIILNT